MRTAKTKKKRTTDEVCDQIANDIAEGVSTARYSRQQLLDCIASQQDALCAEVQKLAVVRSKAVAFAVEVVAEAFPTHQLPLTSNGSRATPKDDWQQRVLAEHKDLHARQPTGRKPSERRNTTKRTGSIFWNSTNKSESL